MIMYGNGSTAVGSGVTPMIFKVWPPSMFSFWNIPATRIGPVRPAKRRLFNAADEAFHMLPGDRPIYLVGESLGSGVASYLAGTYSNKIAGVVLISPFNNLTDVAQHHFPLLPSPVIARRPVPVGNNIYKIIAVNLE